MAIDTKTATAETTTPSPWYEAGSAVYVHGSDVRYTDGWKGDVQKLEGAITSRTATLSRHRFTSPPPRQSHPAHRPYCLGPGAVWNHNRPPGPKQHSEHGREDRRGISLYPQDSVPQRNRNQVSAAPQDKIPFLHIYRT